MNLSVQDYLEFAYGVPSYLMADVPGWAANERFDIEGVMPTETRLVATVQESGTVRLEPPVLATLMVERFALRFRFEEREVPVFELRLAREDRRLGPQLKAVSVDCTAKTVPPLCRFGFSATGYSAKGILWGSFAGILAGTVRRPVVDRTDLAGQFDVDVQWDRESVLSNANPPDSPGDRVSIFTALREQLGLKVEPSRGLAKVMVIEHLERPTEN